MNKKDFRIITSTNEIDLYIQFWPTMSKNWTKWYGIENITCAFITEREEDDPLVIKMREYGEIILYKPFKNEVPDSIQAKATRMYLSTLYPNDYCLIADIDMYILNNEETWNKWFSKVEENKMLCVSSNVPYGGTDKGKFPMAFTTATGKVWKEVINPNNLSYYELFNSWYDMYEHDSKEKVNQPFHQFSDESLLRGLISRWENYGGRESYNHPRCIGIERDDWGVVGKADRRIDRSKWLIDVEKLNSGYYYDSQPLRPFNKHINNIAPILKYIEIPESDWELHNIKEKLKIMSEIPTISTHKEYLEEIFKIKGKLNTIIEFGMGDFSSGLLIENGKNVLSIEMQNQGWYDKISNIFSKRDNWKGVILLGPHTYRSLDFPKNIDLAFVDGHGSSRFDCINDMMDIGCTTIVAHDTQQSSYYWDRVNENNKYKKITFKKHFVWTTIWTKDNELYEKIKDKK